jgi:hypothetical protein
VKDSLEWIMGALLLPVLGMVLVSCSPPLPPAAEVRTEQARQPGQEPYPGIEPKSVDPQGRIEVFTTSLLTDGRFLKIRGKLRNPMPEPVDGVRVLFQIYNMGVGSDAKPIQTIQKEKKIHLDAGATTALRLDLETMYAGGAGGSSFRIEAFAERVGDRDIPPPPGWREE